MKSALFPGSLLAICVPVGTAACQSPFPELPVEGPALVKAVSLPQGIAITKAKRAVIEALTERGWTVASRSPKAIGRLVHRGLDATVPAQTPPPTVDLFSEIHEVYDQGLKKAVSQTTGGYPYLPRTSWQSFWWPEHRSDTV